MREYTEQERLELGIEIVAAMKASAYRVTIEDGRDMALEETEIDRIGYSIADIENMEPDRRKRLMAFAASRKEELRKQAMFVADAALKWMAEQEKPTHAIACDLLRARTLKEFASSHGPHKSLVLEGRDPRPYNLSFCGFNLTLMYFKGVHDMHIIVKESPDCILVVTPCGDSWLKDGHGSPALRMLMREALKAEIERLRNESVSGIPRRGILTV